MSHKNTLTQKGLIAVASLLFFGSGLTLAGQYAMLDYNTVIKVNQARITKSDIARRSLQLQPFFNSTKVPQDKQKEYVQDELIERELLVQAAHNAGLKVTAEDVAEEKAQLLSQQYGGKEDLFERDLKRSSYTPELFNEELAERLLSKGMRERIQKNIKVSESKLKEHYEKNKANYTAPERFSVKHILFHIDEDKNNGDQLALKKANQTLAKIQLGQSFESLAKSESDDGTSNESGGELPLFSKGDMSAAFEKAVLEMNVQEISKTPIKTEFGYHLIKKGPTLAAGPKPFAEAKGIFEARLQAEAEQQALENWLEETRKKAQIELKQS